MQADQEFCCLFFEPQLFYHKYPNPSLVLIAVIDRPPEHNDHFISEFANFLSCFILQYERILIVGDFNIHICCEDQAPVNDFLNVINSFHLIHFVAGPTHRHALSISVNELRTIPVVDHSLISFDTSISKLLALGRDKGTVRLSSAPVPYLNLTPDRYDGAWFKARDTCCHVGVMKDRVTCVNASEQLNCGGKRMCGVQVMCVCPYLHCGSARYQQTAVS